VRRSYNNTEQKNQIAKQTLPIQAKTLMATSAYVEKKLKQNTKQFKNTNLKTAFGTWKTTEENLLHKRQNANLQNSSSAYQLKR
jgi:hypothetical protein